MQQIHVVYRSEEVEHAKAQNLCTYNAMDDLNGLLQHLVTFAGELSEANYSCEMALIDSLDRRQYEPTKGGNQLEAVHEDGVEDSLAILDQFVYGSAAHDLVEAEQADDEVLAADKLSAVVVDELLQH